MRLACFRAESLIQRRAAGVSNAAGLLLEEHLAGCARCRARANLLAQLRELDASERRELTPDRRQRAIGNAIAAAAPPPAAAGATLDLRWPRWYWLPALSVCLVALAVYIGRTQPRALALRRSDHVHEPATAAMSNGDRVLAGAITVDGQPRRAGTLLPPTAAVASETEATLALAQAVVTLSEHGAITWDASRHQLQLERGRVVLDVDPAPHRPFQVTTERFSVIVLGTRFEVSLEGVKLWRGTVQVLAPDGSQLAQLDANGLHEFRATPIVPPAADGGERTNAANATTATPTREPNRLLENARAQLAQHRVADARHILQRALAAPLSANQRAEALSLRAECSLLDADYGRARDGYLRVSSTYRSIAAGQTALFAAGRIEAEHGSKSNARALFARYLARYPNGSFSKEAAQRLASLQ
jgi:hypothetical protein